MARSCLQRRPGPAWRVSACIVSVVSVSPRGGRRLLEPLEGQGVTSQFSSKIIRMRVQLATRGGGGVGGFSVLPIYPGLRI